MNLLLKSLTLFIFLFTLSCNSNKNINNNGNQKTEKEMIQDGFKKAMILYSEKKNDCPYTLKIEGESYLLDPTNLEEKFKEPNKEVWVKYRSLRIPNRCENAVPVEITEIRESK